MVEVPQALLAERRRLGIDRFDEMWEGVLHMVPPPSEEHQRIGTKLLVALEPLAEAAGLLMRYETGVFDPLAESSSNYRTPDLVVFDPSCRSDRGVEGGPALAIEIRSPGDETLEKLDFYARVGLAELLVVDRDDKTVRRWTLDRVTLVERLPDSDGRHRLDSLEVRLATRDQRIIVEAPTGTTVV